MSEDKIGIMSLGVYRPSRVMKSDEISKLADIPEEVIWEKFGLKEKSVSEPEEHVSQMAVCASRQALQGIDPAEIDLVIYYGSEYKDRYVWPVGPVIKKELGLKNAYTFEVMALCATGAIALDVARSMLLSNPDYRRVLLVAASKEADLIDYSRRDTRFMINFADGAAACVLGKGAKNELLASSAITDGTFAWDVYVPAGGSMMRPPRKELREEDFYLDAPDFERMKTDLDQVTLDNFLQVIREAVKKGGGSIEKIDFLGITHMKPSFYQAILENFGLDWENTIYLDHWGHVQAADQLIILKEALEKNRLKEGDLVVLAGAGTGYTWSAASLRWGSLG